jgi:hypothetical protein
MIENLKTLAGNDHVSTLLEQEIKNKIRTIASRQKQYFIHKMQLIEFDKPNKSEFHNGINMELWKKDKSVTESVWRLFEDKNSLTKLLQQLSGQKLETNGPPSGDDFTVIETALDSEKAKIRQ